MGTYVHVSTYVCTYMYVDNLAVEGLHLCSLVRQILFLAILVHANLQSQITGKELNLHVRTYIDLTTVEPLNMDDIKFKKVITLPL